jgi:flagellar export protein FliJ
MAPKFSLQNVLDIRHGKVEVLETEFARLIIAQQLTEARLAALRETHRDLLNELNSAQSGEIDLFQVSRLRLNILEVNASIENVSRELAKQNQEIKKKRSELIAAKQSEETLEILKRKRHEAYLAEQIQIESRLLDDIYIARAFHNQQQGA